MAKEACKLDIHLALDVSNSSADPQFYLSLPIWPSPFVLELFANMKSHLHLCIIPYFLFLTTATLLPFISLFLTLLPHGYRCLLRTPNQIIQIHHTTTVSQCLSMLFCTKILLVMLFSSDLKGQRLEDTLSSK